MDQITLLPTKNNINGLVFTVKVAEPRYSPWLTIVLSPLFFRWNDCLVYMVSISAVTGTKMKQFLFFFPSREGGRKRDRNTDRKIEGNILEGKDT